MSAVSSIFAVLSAICLTVSVPALIMWVVFAVLKNEKKAKVKKFYLVTLISFGVSLVLCVLTNPQTYCDHKFKVKETVEATCTDNGYVLNYCELCDLENKETIKKLEHRFEIIKVNGADMNRCSICGITQEITTTTTEKTSKTKKTTTTTTATKAQMIEYSEIYLEFKQNSLRAKEKYTGNRYIITAKINGIGSGGGLLNFDNSINLTMEKRVGNTIVFFGAEFDEDQKESLLNLNKGDTIAFEGRCGDTGSFFDCVLVK